MPEGRTNQGPGRLLVAVYGVFALAATGRSIMQIAQEWPHPPVPYLLSAFAAVVYVVATAALAKGTRVGARWALATILIELAGVLLVGLWTYVAPETFMVNGQEGESTVWSHFGKGYGYVPLVLPVIGLLWLRHTHRGR